MGKAQLLSENDIAILKEVIRAVRNDATGKVGPKRTHVNQASDIYIAKVPTGGIPGLTIGSPDTAGKATCDIYHINSDDDVVEIAGLNKQVYNLSTSRIDSRYAIVWRTKGGPWIAIDITVESEETGTGTDCVSSLDGNVLDDLPTGTPGSSVYLLGIDADGCLKRYPSGTC